MARKMEDIAGQVRKAHRSGSKVPCEASVWLASGTFFDDAFTPGYRAFVS